MNYYSSLKSNAIFSVDTWSAILERFGAQRVSRIQQVWTSDVGSMAHETALSTWPDIIQDMVDEMADLTQFSRPFQKSEARAITEELRRIKDDIKNNRQLRPLRFDGREDVDRINHQLNSYPEALTWQAAPWLFAECYLYRRVESTLSRTKNWKGFDLFKRYKVAAFLDSQTVIEGLIESYVDAQYDRSSFGYPDVNDEQQKQAFVDMIRMALWGDSAGPPAPNESLTDSPHVGPTQPFATKDDKYILDDDTDAVWAYLSNNARSSRSIDIVLGTSGLSLLKDLIFALYLLDTRLASSVVLHVKSFPWFIADCTRDDFTSLLSDLESESTFPNRQHISSFVAKLHKHLDNGTIAVRNHHFWTTCHTFHEMDAQAPALLQSLRTSALVIFKGDLNYRRLIHDGRWSCTTPFADALGRSLGPASGCSVLALRINESDLCVGLDPSRLLPLPEDTAGVREVFPREWVYKTAVVSFSDGSKVSQERSILDLFS